MSDDDAGADAAVVFRVLGYPSPEVREDYRTSFDTSLAEGVAEHLSEYLVGFAEANSDNTTVVLEGNSIDLRKPDELHLVITCYERDLFDVTRWPATSEFSELGKIRVELAAPLDGDHMIYLARRFIINGHLDD